MYLVLSAFISNQVHLLSITKPSIFLQFVASAQYINITSRNQKLMLTIKFQAPPKGKKLSSFSNLPDLL
jgi:hypothetical protein